MNYFFDSNHWRWAIMVMVIWCLSYLMSGFFKSIHWQPCDVQPIKPSDVRLLQVQSLTITIRPSDVWILQSLTIRPSDVWLLASCNQNIWFLVNSGFFQYIVWSISSWILLNFTKVQFNRDRPGDFLFTRTSPYLTVLCFIANKLNSWVLTPQILLGNDYTRANWYQYMSILSSLPASSRALLHTMAPPPPSRPSGASTPPMQHPLLQPIRGDISRRLGGGSQASGLPTPAQLRASWTPASWTARQLNTRCLTSGFLQSENLISGKFWLLPFYCLINF